MDNKDNKKDIRLGIISTVLMSIIGSLAGIIPFTGILVYFIAILFFICAKRSGFIFTLPFLIASYVFVSFSTSFSAAIADIFGPGMSALVMGELIRLRRNHGEVLGKGILTGILCNLASIVCLRFVEKKSIIEELRKNIEYVINSSIDSEKMTIHAANALKQTYDSLLQAVPAMLIVVIFIGSLFIYYSGCSIMKRRGEEIEGYYPFSNFSFSRNIVAGCLIVLIAGYLTGLIGILDKNVIMINISIIICFVFAIQGLAVTVFLVNISRFPKIIFYILMCMMLISMIGTIFLFIIGILDIIFNFRKRIIAKSR